MHMRSIINLLLWVYLRLCAEFLFCFNVASLPYTDFVV